MKSFIPLMAATLCITARAATSDLYFPTQGASISGTPGNILFSGGTFVVPTASPTNGVRLTTLTTNAAIVSTTSLGFTGSTVRVWPNGTNWVISWIDSADTPNRLLTAVVSNGAVGAHAIVASNIAEESVSFSRAGDSVLAVWQDTSGIPQITACMLDSNGVPSGQPFVVSPNAQAQQFPSADNNGTNFLICWMEQNQTNTDWRVIARAVTEGAPDGAAVTVSETNSKRAHATACCFGTNFLLAWSADESPLSIWDPGTGTYTNLWRAAVRTRLWASGVPQGHETAMLRMAHANTNVSLGFGNGRYVLSAMSSYGQGRYLRGNYRGYVQMLHADGTRSGYPFEAFSGPEGASVPPRISAARGCFCVVYSGPQGASAFILGPKTMDLGMARVRRAANGMAVEGAVPFLVVSTNLINWSPASTSELPSMSGKPRLFARLYSAEWSCVEQLRAIQWAKQMWAFDEGRDTTDQPSASELFGPGKYLAEPPVCPLQGTYSIYEISTKATCAIGGHTL